MVQADMFTGGFSRPSVVEWLESDRDVYPHCNELYLTYDVRLDNGDYDKIQLSIAPWSHNKMYWDALNIILSADENYLHTTEIMPLYEDEPKEFEERWLDMVATDAMNIPSDLIEAMTKEVKKMSNGIYNKSLRAREIHADR